MSADDRGSEEAGQSLPGAVKTSEPSVSTPSDWVPQSSLGMKVVVVLQEGVMDTDEDFAPPPGLIKSFTATILLHT